jgi:Spy/CpxP family protein refolding chaperone
MAQAQDFDSRICPFPEPPMAISLALNARRPMLLMSFTVLTALSAVFAHHAMAQVGPPMHPMGGPDMMMMGGGGGRHMQAMLEGVNATAEQRTQIQQIIKTAHDDLRSQREAGKALHQRSRALFAQPNIDAAAAESLRQQMSAQHDAASKRMLQAMLDISRVLTPEQRKTLTDRMAQREALMERHRTEREALDKAAR